MKAEIGFVLVAKDFTNGHEYVVVKSFHRTRAGVAVMQRMLRREVRKKEKSRGMGRSAAFSIVAARRTHHAVFIESELVKLANWLKEEG